MKLTYIFDAPYEALLNSTFMTDGRRVTGENVNLQKLKEHYILTVYKTVDVCLNTRINFQKKITHLNKLTC